MDETFGGRESVPNRVLLIFDDGYQSIFRETFPIIKQQFRCPKALFLSGYFVDNFVTGWQVCVVVSVLESGEKPVLK